MIYLLIMDMLGNTTLLADREVNDPKENQPLVFGQGFGGITDIEVGPDGYYVCIELYWISV